MEKPLNHTCCLCGKKYYHCNEEDKTADGFVSYKAVCDTKEHYDIYKIFLEYGRNKLSRAEAKKELSKLDIKDKDSWNNYIKGMVDEIFGVDIVKSKRLATKKSVETIDDEI